MNDSDQSFSFRNYFFEQRLSEVNRRNKKSNHPKRTVKILATEVNPIQDEPFRDAKGWEQTKNPPPSH